MDNNKQIKISPLGFPWETQDPFLFCAYHMDKYPNGNGKLGPDKSLDGRNIGQDFTVKDGFRMYHGRSIPGFPYHPHRGFETITIAHQGYVDHADSLGSAGRFGAGDVQWMTAGKGVQHSEMFPLLNENDDNPLEIFQIWLNLPRASKMVEPHFQMLWKKSIPVVTHHDENDNAIKVTVIAGQYHSSKAPEPTPDSWANNPENLVNVWTIELEPHAEWDIPVADGELTRSLYFYDGEQINIQGNDVYSHHKIDLPPSQSIRIKNGDVPSKFLFLQGKPLKEPVVQYGPFVMNTAAEIDAAIYDYQRTQFGGWPWSQVDPTHGGDKKRFAVHANGKKEVGED